MKQTVKVWNLIACVNYQTVFLTVMYGSEKYIIADTTYGTVYFIMATLIFWTDTS